jgi:hypothetical protein
LHFTSFDFDFSSSIFLTHDDGGGFGRKDDVEWIHVKIKVKIIISIGLFYKTKIKLEIVVKIDVVRNKRALNSFSPKKNQNCV